MQEVESVSDWLLGLISKEHVDTIQKVASVLSGIWFSRNKRVWEGKVIQPATTIELSAKQIQDWQVANRGKLPVINVQVETAPEKQVKWQPPEAGWLKLNVDASLVRGDNMFALGLVIRSEVGQSIMGKNMKLAGEVSVMEAEARGVLEAIAWIENMELHNVAIETDSQLVVQALRSSESYQLEVRHLLDECKERVKSRADLSICYVEKLANKAAHLMARISCLLNSYNCFTSPPDLLLATLPDEFST